MTITIELCGISAGYLPGEDVLRSLDLTLEPGLTQLIGTNGSGKSTALDVMAGTLRAHSGTVTLLGHPAHTASAWSVRSVCRTVVALFPGLTVGEHVTLLELGHGVDRRRLADRLAAYGLEPWYDVPVGELSTGNLRKAWIVLSTAAERDILLLDEPFTGLDSAGIDVITREIRQWQDGGHTVVLVTHQREQGLEPDLLIDIARVRDGGRSVA